MAVDYIILNDKNEYGMIAINKSVFESIATLAIQDIEDVKLATGAFARPIQMKIDDNKLNVEANIKVSYGVNVSATCEKVQNKIYENISFMTGYKPNQVTVNVTGFII